MDIISVKYTTQENMFVLVNDEFSVPVDLYNRHWREIVKWVTEGNAIEEADPIVNVVSVTRLQFRRALVSIGKRAALRTLLAAQEAADNFTLIDYFNCAQVMRRDDPEIEELRILASLTEQQMDDLFDLAKSL